VTTSIRKIAAGDGYAYPLRSVVRGERDRSAPDRVTLYYLEVGPVGLLVRFRDEREAL
jgi:hypothetical protein